jgi:two-component system, LytTR family, response regulator LytT
LGDIVLNIAICDDLEIDIQILIDMIEKYCLNNKLDTKFSTYINGKELLIDFAVNKFNVVFLDIYMNDKGGLTGIQVAKKIKSIDKNCIIIFMTTSKDHALDAFEVDAMQYIVKPISYDKITQLFNKFQKLFLHDMHFIEVLSNRISHKILLKDIYYIEVYDKTCLIHLNNKIIKTYTPLSKLWKLLDGTPFLKCHRCYIINMFHVDNILESDFILKNNAKIPISKDKSSSIKQIYYDYFFEQMRD